MRSIVDDQQPRITELCRKFAVRRLDLFGSAATGDDFDKKISDLDFLVEFEPSDMIGPSDQYFGLLEALGDLFGRQIDLVTARSLKNPYFIKSVNDTRQALYASEISKAS